MNQNCPFCTSARKENRILKEGKFAYVILSRPRLMPGHILVIPKRHIEGQLEELTPEERVEIFDFLSGFQAKILKKISSGCDIRQNYKPYVENSRTHVNHMHFHLNPRGYKDEMYERVDIHREPFYQNLSEEEKNRIFTLLSG